ncbi:TolC family protein [Aureliella helgolandensis]|uniref:Outer membrane efflux protein n=1 Tax=Aureliella helgolandensis TaxID=2527968 RepID=A0A518GGE3_9BACT|nr:TolC family protein [Aureliella helgolandensis]QDV27665.1 Outer membrane efflux protein [Aureliella helgolandensis]
MQSLRKKRAMRWLAVMLAASTGCSGVRKFNFSDSWESAPSYHASVATQIEYPNVRSNLIPQVADIPAPHALENPSELPARELDLNEAIRIAISQSDILRSIGGSVVQNAAGTQTNYDPARTETNPLGGVEAALSAFDVQATGAMFWQKNNRPNNTSFLIFQPQALEQTTGNFSYELAKKTATGASFALRHSMLYDNNNSPARLFASDYNGFFEGEYRQPLLRGGGVEFNRIAGPNSGIGQYNGVLIARINTDISLADFEQGIITFTNDVETAYWELFFAYHNLESQVAGRNSSLLTWQRIKELQKVGARGGDAAAEAQARSQYYLFDVQVKDSLTGPNGLYAAEQKLRYLMGLPATDGQLLKPISDPMEGEVVVDWQTSLNDALTKRVEIRRQKWNIKRRELEMIAAKLNRRPTLDFLGKYRYRGLGDQLIGHYDPNNSFNSVYQNIFEGDYQEWQAGVELGYPVGLRQASAAVANARWNLAREQSLLEEQELKISHDLSSSLRQIQRSYELMKSNYNRQESDRDQVAALQARYESGLDNINFLLQAQQQLATSQSAYFRSLVDYQLALRDFHRERGSLLNYNQIGLSEGAWPAGAYQDAVERGRFLTPRNNPEAVEVPSPVSGGGFNPTQVGAVGILPAPATPEAIVTP